MRARGQGGSSSDGGGSDSDDAQTLPVAEQRVVPPRYRALLAFICVLALGATWYCNIYFVQEATGGRVPATVSELTVGLTRFLLGNAYLCSTRRGTSLGAPEHCHHSLCIRVHAPPRPWNRELCAPSGFSCCCRVVPSAGRHLHLCGC